MYSDFTDYNVTKKRDISFASKKHYVQVSRGNIPKYLGFLYGHIALLSYIKHLSKNILFILTFYCIYLYCI